MKLSSPLYLFILGLALFFSTVALAQEADIVTTSPEQPVASSGDRIASPPSEREGHSVVGAVLLYLPNRVLDLLDIFRARVRVGPGLAVGARATKAVQAYAGAYTSVYAGLPGPRMRRFPRSPVGVESHNGIDLSVMEASVDGGIGPDYSPTEFGVGTQLGVVGVDVGFDPFEIVDFAAGLFFIDLRDDDL